MAQFSMEIMRLTGSVLRGNQHNERVAMFELTVEGDMVKIVEERHYKLVLASEIDRAAIISYR